MKRARIVLGSVAVLAIVGSALAFKAKQAVSIYTHNPNDLETVCTSKLDNWKTTAVAPIQTLATTNPALPCVLQRITTTD